MTMQQLNAYVTGTRQLQRDADAEKHGVGVLYEVYHL